MTYSQKLSSLLLFAIVATLALPFFIEMHWWYVPIIIFNYCLFKGVGSEIGAHRLWSHRSFKTSNRKKKIIMALHLIAGEGSCLSFVGVHRIHHANSDTKQDPHSPYHQGLFNTTFYLHNIYGFSNKLVADVLREPWMVKQHKHYFTWHLAIITLLSLISLTLLWFYAVNIVSSLVINYFVNVVSHKYGTQPYPYGVDQSRNCGWIKPILLGVELHNNHHHNPGSYTNAVHKGEWDMWAWIIRKFLANDISK